jgi:hypothetical protein
MTKYLPASKWNQMRDIRPEDEMPQPAQPKILPPTHIVAVSAQGTRLVIR